MQCAVLKKPLVLCDVRYCHSPLPCAVLRQPAHVVSQVLVALRAEREHALVSCPICLRRRPYYAMPGTDIAQCYAMPGTGIPSTELCPVSFELWHAL
eukprot:3646807-Rhodomonas_salina.1